jgi:hypothetical protein
MNDVPYFAARRIGDGDLWQIIAPNTSPFGPAWWRDISSAKLFTQVRVGPCTTHKMISEN